MIALVVLTAFLIGGHKVCGALRVWSAEMTGFEHSPISAIILLVYAAHMFVSGAANDDCDIRNSKGVTVH
jgi:hypothetical protein